ncbi:MAG: hypothetical protein FJX62_06590 [Alphaproteobacteria bacterium]|nr:hypothetical protein [Alphaproteobacteria bacterium]
MKLKSKFESLRRPVAFAAVLTGLMSITSPYTIEPAAAAARTPEQCLARFNRCTERCARRYKDYPACIYRTCNPQYNRCIADAEGPSVQNSKPDGGSPTGGVGGHHSSGPFSTGILGATQGLPTQGPSPAGAAAPAPAAPASSGGGIIR